MDITYKYKQNQKEHRIEFMYNMKEACDQVYLNPNMLRQFQLPRYATTDEYIPLIDALVRRLSEIDGYTYGVE